MRKAKYLHETSLRLGLGVGLSGGGTGEPPAPDADVEAFLARMAVQPSTEQAAAYDYFVRQAKSIGVWTYITDCGFLGGHDVQSSKLGVKGVIDLTAVGSESTHYPGYGFKGNGTSQAYTTGYKIPSGDQNDASIAVYVLTQGSANASIMGNANTVINARHSSTPNTAFYRVNAGSSASVASTDSVGFFIANRLGGTDQKLWKHGLSNATSSGASETPDATYNIYVCGRNGATPEYSGRTVAFWHVGKGVPEALIPGYSALVEATCARLSASVSVLSSMTAETRSLYRAFVAQGRKPSYHFGAFENREWPIGRTPELVPDIETITGKLPSIISHEWVDTAGLNAAESATQLARIKANYALGIITSLHHHPGNPVTGSFEQVPTPDNGTTGNQYDQSGSPVVNCLSGGSKRTEFMAYTDRVIAFLNSCVTDSGTKIPVILRWFHEIDGGWFWWTDAATPANTVQMWKDFVDRIKAAGVTNVLFDLNRTIQTTPSASYYPGVTYCDILSGDYYDNDGTIAGLSAAASNLLSLQSNGSYAKPLWIGEFGYSGAAATDTSAWTTKTGYYHRDSLSISAGCLVWRSPFGPAVGDASNSDLLAMASEASCLMIEAAVSPSNISVPTISGTAAEGQTLTAGNGTWSGSPSSYAYQWKRSGSDISGATSSTYDLVSGDVGSTITVSVVATNAYGSSSPATSSATATVASGIPANTSIPTISDTTPAVGDTLTGDVGSWTNSPSSYTYQWYADASPISGATSATYLVDAADEGAVLTFGVIATNGYGSSSEELSAGTAAVSAASGAPAYESWTGPGWIDFSDTATLTLTGSNIDAVANKRSGGGDLTYGGASGKIVSTASIQNGLAVARLTRDVTSNTSEPRLVASTAADISTMFGGSDAAFTVIAVYIPRDANAGFVWSASQWTNSSTFENVSLVRRATPNSSARKWHNSATTGTDVNFGSGHASGTPYIVAIKHTGTAVSVWENSTTKAQDAVSQDVATLTGTVEFALGAAHSTSSLGPWNTTQMTQDLCEFVIEDSAKSDADIQQAITDFADKWGITLV